MLHKICIFDPDLQLAYYSEHSTFEEAMTALAEVDKQYGTDHYVSYRRDKG